MSTYLQTQAAYYNFLRYASESKLILLHPASRYRSVVVARLIGDDNLRALYYALDADDINLRDFLAGITRALSRQRPSFGRHLKALPAAALAKPQKHFKRVLRAFRAEIEDIQTDELYLVLDDFDRAETSDDVLRFIERFSHDMSTRCHVVLSGRSLPRLPWLSMIAKRHALIISDSMLTRNRFYERENVPDAPIKALGLGPGYVFRDDFLVDAWEGRLPRMLLFFALEVPQLTRDQICDTFWSNLKPNKAVNVFHVTKQRLHEAIGDDMMVYENRYYCFSPETPLYYDAVEFVETLLEGRYGAPSDSFAVWQRAAKLYRGPFLEGNDDDWISERREAYHSAYMEVINHIADHWLLQENHELALYTLKQVLTADFSREEIHMKLLKLYAQLGRRAEAISHYREMQKWATANRRPLSGAAEQLFSDITV